jgi:hypothetical protein
MKKYHGTSRRGFLQKSFLAGAGIVGLSMTRFADGQTGGESGSTTGPGANTEIRLESVETIYTDGRWNGRPSIGFWKGTYYVAFRSAFGHGSDDGIGKAMMLKSTDLKEWSASTIIDHADVDVAEPLLLVTNERLFMYIVAEYPVTTSFMTYSDDGVTWAAPKPVYLSGYSFSSTAEHKGVYYAPADRGHVELLKSTNGFDWTRISNIVESGTETALVFLKDESLVAVVRQRQIARAKPPYTHWERHQGIALDGPDAALVGDTVLAAGRHGGQTALFRLHQDTMKLKFLMNMPVHHWAVGDKAYPEFLVINDRRVLMVYYDGEAYEKAVPKRADIRLATFTL